MILQRLSLLFLILFASSLTAQTVGKVTFPLNRVFIVPAGTNALEYATFNSKIGAGDIVQTRSKSRCEILLDTGETIRLGSNTAFSIEIADGETRCLLSVGKVWIDDGVNGGSMRIITPAAEVHTDSAQFRIEALKNGTTEILVYAGTVDSRKSLGHAVSIEGLSAKREPVAISADSVSTTVISGQSLSVDKDGQTTIAEFNIDKDELLDWVSWNRKRERLMSEQRKRDAGKREYRARGN